MIIVRLTYYSRNLLDRLGGPIREGINDILIESVANNRCDDVTGALRAAADLAQGIEVDADRMRANVDLTHGLIMAEAIVIALAGKIGPQEARKIVEAATRKAVAEKRSLQNVLGDDARVSAHLSGPTLGRLFDPMSYQGAAQTFIDRLIGSLKSGGKRL